MMLRKTITPICLISAAMLASCSLMKPNINMDALERAPASFGLTDTNSILQTAWWKTFENAELDNLITQAFSHNLSLAQTAARFRQASASASKLSAASFPSVSGSASISSSEQNRTSEDGSTTRVSTDNYGLGLAASYELDLWGRVHSVRRSAGLNAEASFLDLETATMSLSARITELWIQIIEAKAQLEITEKQIEAYQQSLDLLKERASKSSTSLLDVYQQEQLLRTSESRLPAAKQKLELLKNELDVLLGEHAGTGPAVSTASLPDLPAVPSAGLPPDLLSNRPDVKAWQLRLRASGWDVASAHADRFPAIRLSAKYEYGSDSTSTLFDNWISSLAASLSAPLLDGGLKRAEERRTKAALDGYMAAYRETILEAYKEVQNALIRQQRTEETLTALTRQLESASKALDEASRRYRNGNASYLNVLTALRSLYQTEMDLVSAHSSLLQARVSLHRALGGTWSHETAADTVNRNMEETLRTPDKDNGHE